MKFETADPDVIRELVKTPSDLIDFLVYLIQEIVPDDEEVRERKISDALTAAANWLEDTEPSDIPNPPDWGFVALLFLGAIHYN